MAIEHDTIPHDFIVSAVQSVVVNLDASDIATLNSVPVEIVAAQGADTMIVPVSVSTITRFGTVAFDNMGALAFKIGPSMSPVQVNTGFHELQDSFAGGSAGAQFQNFDLSQVEDEPLMAMTDADDTAGGDGTARIQVLYYVMDLSS